MPNEADETTVTGTGTNTGETPTEAPNPKPETEEKRFTQAELNRMIADEKRKERERLKKEQEDANLAAQGEFKTLLEKANARVQELEAELASERLGRVRERMGRKYDLPESFWNRLIGADETEIEADAKKIKKDLDSRASAATDSLPPGTPPGGKGNGGNVGSLEDRKRAVRAGGGYGI